VSFFKVKMNALINSFRLQIVLMLNMYINVNINVNININIKMHFILSLFSDFAR